MVYDIMIMVSSFDIICDIMRQAGCRRWGDVAAPAGVKLLHYARSRSLRGAWSIGKQGCSRPDSGAEAPATQLRLERG